MSEHSRRLFAGKASELAQQQPRRRRRHLMAALTGSEAEDQPMFQGLAPGTASLSTTLQAPTSPWQQQQRDQDEPLALDNIASAEEEKLLPLRSLAADLADGVGDNLGADAFASVIRASTPSPGQQTQSQSRGTRSTTEEEVQVDPCTVTAFGFPPCDAPQVLARFEQVIGAPIRRVRAAPFGRGNWLAVQVRTPEQARLLLAQNGSMVNDCILGVQKGAPTLVDFQKDTFAQRSGALFSPDDTDAAMYRCSHVFPFLTERVKRHVCLCVSRRRWRLRVSDEHLLHANGRPRRSCCDRIMHALFGT
ncbi:MAG: hypothetical protein MHM6MM_000522 [Cercozoa sp. M6MM]